MALLLVVLFIVVPIVEIYVIIKIGGLIGILPTIALLILDAFLGAALLRSQGRAVWRRFNEALAAGRIPAREVFDGVMVIFGGALLMTPGFITDIVGLLFLIPPSRAMFRGIVSKLAMGRAAFAIRTAKWGSRARDHYRARSGRSYDYEGSAREVGKQEHELPRPQGDGKP